jgi:phospholipid/cholesterol/gamma-HCH transport system substrate-binding protein
VNAFRAGLLAIVVIVLFAFFGFTRTNPFATPYELRAVFDDARNLATGSPVRIAGVAVGQVTRVEATAMAATPPR